MKIKSLILFVLSILNFVYLFSQASLSAEELAVKMSDRLIDETTYRFINTKTGETFINMKEVPFSMDVKVESKYNKWHYTNGVLQLALLELSDLKADKKYENFVLRNMNFVFDKNNHSYFERQFNEAFNERGWRGVRNLSWHMIFRNKRLDDNGPMGATLIDLSMRMRYKNKRFIDYINSTDKHIMLSETRLTDGTIARLWPHENTIWADDLFMGLSFLTRMGKMKDDVKYFDECANQVFNYHKYLWDSNKEIYYHCYHTNLEEHGVAHWSRANGWMLMAKADLLTMLPIDHPDRNALIENFNQQVKGILRYQGKNGLWYQILDKTDSYEEITGTAMFVFAIARGVRKGWINKDYIYAAEQGLRGIKTKMTDEGDVSAICVGTGIMPSLTFYYNRPTQENDPMGEGPVLRALIEMSLAQKYSEISADEQYNKIKK